jgi:hypothetical protein
MKKMKRRRKMTTETMVQIPLSLAKTLVMITGGKHEYWRENIQLGACIDNARRLNQSIKQGQYTDTVNPLQRADNG